MTIRPASDSSIFRDGKLKPGTYKIQNIYTETYLDIEVHSRGVHCRPAKDLGEGRGLWEIRSFGAGYTVQFVEPGKPEQFCTLMQGLKDSPLSVAAYPVAWRVEIVDDVKHRGFEYARVYWGTTNLAWDVAEGSNANGAQVLAWTDAESQPWRIWKLIPINAGDVFTPSWSPFETFGPYDENASGQSSTRVQYANPERDDLGTIVTEVTTVTTRRRYRVEDA